MLANDLVYVSQLFQIFRDVSKILALSSVFQIQNKLTTSDCTRRLLQRSERTRFAPSRDVIVIVDNLSNTIFREIL